MNSVAYFFVRLCVQPNNLQYGSGNNHVRSMFFSALEIWL